MKHNKEENVLVPINILERVIIKSKILYWEGNEENRNEDENWGEFSALEECLEDHKIIHGDSNGDKPSIIKVDEKSLKHYKEGQLRLT